MRTLIDSVINDGLWDHYNDQHMGISAKMWPKNTPSLASARTSLQWSRIAARRPHGRKALRRGSGAGRDSREEGYRQHSSTEDESIRPDVSLEALGSPSPAFKKDGTVTAGNAPGLNDAAAAVVVMSASKAESLGLKPMAHIRAQATSGVDPKWIMLAPVTGVQKVLAKAGWAISDVDLFELNEAFSVQALGVTYELGLGLEKCECQRRSGRDRPSHRGQRRPGAGDAAS